MMLGILQPNEGNIVMCNMNSNSAKLRKNRLFVWMMKDYIQILRPMRIWSFMIGFIIQLKTENVSPIC